MVTVEPDMRSTNTEEAAAAMLPGIKIKALNLAPSRTPIAKHSPKEKTIIAPRRQSVGQAFLTNCFCLIRQGQKPWTKDSLLGQNRQIGVRARPTTSQDVRPFGNLLATMNRSNRFRAPGRNLARRHQRMNGALLLIAVSFGLVPSSLNAQNNGRWKRVATPSLIGGAPSQALMRVADIDRSDSGFVGMMIQCREKRLQTVLVVIEPLPPGQSAEVTFKAAGSATEVRGVPIVTGAGIAVPIDLMSRLNVLWRGEPDLDVVIKTRGSLHGTVPLAGLLSLLGAFDSDCRAGASTASGTNPAGP